MSTKFSKLVQVAIKQMPASWQSPTNKDSAGYRITPANRVTPYTPTVQRNANQKQVLTNMRNSDERASGYYPTKFPIRSFKKGGKVPKTGIYKLHKGEKVVPKKGKK